jgi:hypothetical protein
MAAGCVEEGDERERLREAVPPRTAVPEERDKLLALVTDYSTAETGL